MSDLTFSGATPLTGTTIASGDLFPVLDVSASAGSKGSNITLTELFSGRTLLGGTHIAITGLGLRSTGAAFDLTLATSEVLTAGRSLSFNVGDANRVLTIPATGTAALLGTANTFSAANIFSAAGAASTPAVKYNGALFTGGSATTTKPLLLLEPAGATTNNWNTFGSYIGINGSAADSTSGFFFDFQKDGARVASMNLSGVFSIPSGTVGAFAFVPAAAGYIQWAGRAILYSPADGVIRMMNAAENSFGRLCFGPATSGFTALKANTTTLQCRIADDSAYAAFDALSYKVGGTAGATGGTFTAITSITVVNGIITAISGT